MSGVIGSDFLGLDPASAPPRGRTAWLADRLRTAIADGTLTPGTRLPASRALAEELHLARGTVVEAYQRLGEEGVLVTNRGGGTVVADLVPSPGPGPRTGTAAAPTPAPTTDPLNISAGVPDVTAFPRAAWLRAERRLLATATDRDLGYADPQGAPALRQALARWLARSRGVTVDADRILITGGVTGALSLLSQVLRARGITECAVEDPGSNGNRQILGHWLDRLHPIPVDADGLRTDELAQTPARAVLITPAHQFPTGVVLAPERRRALIDWAETTGGYIIEDDYDAEYRYDRQPVRAMHASAPERIAYVASLSKVLAPALRLGWLIAPRDLHDELVHTRWATDLGSPALPQLALAELIDSGVLERHLRTLRSRHRARRDAAVAAIERYLPDCRVEGIAAGLHLLVRLPAHLDDRELAGRAAAAGIEVLALSALSSTPGPPGLVIGYGPHSPQRLAEALRRLGELIGG